MSILDACLLVNSGDLVLFSDKSFNASFITTICACRWSHLGIILRRKNGRPLLLESVKSLGDDIDVTTKRKQAGVRLIDFETHLKHFSGKAVAIRPLMTKKELNASKQLRRHMTTVIDNVYESEQYKPYADSFIDFILARFPIIEKRSESNDKFFCSKLVAWCYMRGGLLSTSVLPSSFLPDDFSSTGDVKLSYPSFLNFPGLSATPSELIKFGDEMYINTTIQ